MHGQADENSGLIYWLNTHTTVPYNPCAIRDELDIVITKYLIIPMYPTTCSALTSDHLPTLIDTRGRSSFFNPLDRPDLRRTDLSKNRTCLESGLPSNADFPNDVAIYSCVNELSSAISKALAQSNPNCFPHDDPRPHIGLYPGCNSPNSGRWQICRDPDLIYKANRIQGRCPTSSTSGGRSSGA
jgi:hypothetical protein